MVGRLARYARWGDRVKGFFEPGLLQLYLALDDLHEARGVHGAVAEIGVFHGKSFIPLALLCREAHGPHRASELCLAVDCFESQEHNRDQSGEGDRTAFERNVKAAMRACCEGKGTSEGDRIQGLGDDGDWLRVIEADSITLSPSEVSAAVDGQPIRLFSVDGSHTAEATAADLSTAATVLHPEGAVIVDDAFNPDWPGVMTGLFNWYNANCHDQLAAGAAGRTNDDKGIWNVPALVPFAIGFNKVVMCRPEMHATYFEHLVSGGEGGDRRQSDSAWPRVRKTASFLGHDVAVFSHGWIATFHGNE